MGSHLREEDKLSTLDDILNWTIPYLNVTVSEFIIAVLITLVLAIVLFFVVLRMLRGTMERSRIPPLLTDLLVRITRLILGVAVLLAFLSLIGFNISSLILASAAIFGLILGFGMSETMNNFFSGIAIAVNRPIEKGEYVTIDGMSGNVEEVAMMFTKLVTLENNLIIIPNGKVWGQAIINYERKGLRRVDINVNVPYSADIREAVRASIEMMKEHPMILSDPEPAVFMNDLDESSVQVQLRPWVSIEHYWPVANDMRLNILDALKEVGIKVPFPQLDVHIKGSHKGAPISV